MLVGKFEYGRASSSPIRCANQDSEIKDPNRGIGPEGNNERKKPKSPDTSLMG
jgi:hypothetical protein